MRSQLMLAAVERAFNDAPAYSGIASPMIMTISCLLVLFLASRNIEKPHVGPKMPLGPLGPIFNNISIAGFIGSMCFGHILGTLAILGLARY